MPSGIVMDAEMTEASGDGKKWNATQPAATMPPVTMSVDTPIASDR